MYQRKLSDDFWGANHFRAEDRVEAAMEENLELRIWAALNTPHLRQGIEQSLNKIYEKDS